MTINGTTTIATYFILNKKDRAGKGQVRPFHAVLEAMKKQETEEAKLKQSSSLKAGIQNLPPPPPPTTAAHTPRENGMVESFAPPPAVHHPPPPPAVHHPPPQAYQPPAPVPAPVHRNEARYMPAEMEIPVPVKASRYEETSAGYGQNSMMKNKYPDEYQMRGSEMMNDQYGSAKSYDRQLQRSRACDLL